MAEAGAIARSAPVASAVVAVVAAIMCVAVFATAGRAAVTEAEVVARIDEAGSRLITMTTTGAEMMPADVVAHAGRLEEVSWALGLGPVADVRNAWVDGESAPGRGVVGLPVPDLALDSGRWPVGGEAVVSARSARTLGLAAAAGAVVDRSGGAVTSVVGSYTAVGALAGIDHLVLRGQGPGDTTVTSVYVLAADVRDVPALAVVLREISGVEDQGDLVVTTSQALVDLSEVVSGRLGAFSRELAAGALVAGGGFVAVTMLSIVAGRRRDMGRRRALGASRSALVMLVAAQAGIPAAAGAILGTLIGIVVADRQAGAVPALGFCVAVPLLAVLASLVGAVPAALAAAWRDPVRILRVP